MGAAQLCTANCSSIMPGAALDHVGCEPVKAKDGSAPLSFLNGRPMVFASAMAKAVLPMPGLPNNKMGVT